MLWYVSPFICFDLLKMARNCLAFNFTSRCNPKPQFCITLTLVNSCYLPLPHFCPLCESHFDFHFRSTLSSVATTDFGFRNSVETLSTTRPTATSTSSATAPTFTGSTSSRAAFSTRCRRTRPPASTFARSTLSTSSSWPEQSTERSRPGIRGLASASASSTAPWRLSAMTLQRETR